MFKSANYVFENILNYSKLVSLNLNSVFNITDSGIVLDLLDLLLIKRLEEFYFNNNFINTSFIISSSKLINVDKIKIFSIYR